MFAQDALDQIGKGNFPDILMQKPKNLEFPDDEAANIQQQQQSQAAFNNRVSSGGNMSTWMR